RWHALARLALRDDVYSSLRAITLDALQHSDPGQTSAQKIEMDMISPDRQYTLFLDGAEITLPIPDPAKWRTQLLDVYAQLRDQYLRYPGISRAALATVPTHLETLRVSEGILAILLAGGIEPQKAAWARDALTLYVCGYALERSLVQLRGDQEWVVSREDLVERLTALPPDRFPNTRRYATELTAGSERDRYDFAMNLIIDNLT
ncbi:TetR/AcrR family transcriptional regulator C-terminal domain-containing protein, partial [Kibdelosporangium lantanae]